MSPREEYLPPSIVHGSNNFAVESMNEEISSSNEAAKSVKDVDEDGHEEPISSRRKRLLLLACLCILGEMISA